MDRTEAAFPAAPLRQADARRLASRTRPNAYFSASSAAPDASDALGTYGSCQPPLEPLPARDLLRRHQMATGSLPAASSKGDGAPAAMAGQPFSAGPGAFFITQRGTVAGPAAAAGSSQQAAGATGGAASRVSLGDDGTHAAARASVSSADPAAGTSNGALTASVRGGQYVGSAGGGDGNGGALAAPQAAALEPQMMVAPTRIEPGSHNPVPAWHNLHLSARQAGRGALQRDLWHRSKRRAAYRSSPKLAADLTRRLMTDLEEAEGHLAPGWVPGELGMEAMTPATVNCCKEAQPLRCL